MNAKKTPDAGHGVEGNEPNPREEVGDSCTSVPPTAADISQLMRTMPKPGAPAVERAAWLDRKVAMLASIAAAKR